MGRTELKMRRFVIRKSAKDLTISEAAVLTGSLKHRNVYNPIDDMESTVNAVLQLMADNGKSRKKKPIKRLPAITVTDNVWSQCPQNVHTYFDAVINEITTKYGISEEDLLTKDIKTYTGLDQICKRIWSETFSHSWLFPRKRLDGNGRSSGLIAMDPETGDVLADGGGRT